jgi:hypothetical protein
MTNAKFAMLKLSIVCAMGLGTSAIVPAAAAANGPYRAEATLATPVQSATEKDIDGVTWRCEGDKCFGKAEKRASTAAAVRCTAATSRTATTTPLRKSAAPAHPAPAALAHPCAAAFGPTRVRASAASADALESPACITPRSKTSTSFSMT